MATAYQGEDGQPRYGQRLSPEELADYWREQGGEPPVVRAAASQPSNPPLARPAEPSLRPEQVSADYVPGRRRRGSSRWRVLVVGLIMMLVIPLVLLVGAVTMVVDGPLSGGAVLGEGGTAYLEQGSRSALYSSDIGASTEDCSVTDPQGQAVVLEGSGDESLPYAVFTPSVAGRYQVTCPGGTQGIVVGPPMRAENVGAAGAMVLSALAMGALGLVITVAGGLRASRR